ncbi:MAG TPA: amidohydrolase family protein [Gemmatimonadaceae bacterium]|nr:amidohydrolase family protein [Gemmatimonadaceae bacterium]
MKGFRLRIADCGVLAVAMIAGTSTAQNAVRPAQRAPAQSAILIRNATIVPVTGPRIPNGTLVIRGDRIEALGPNVTAPADARVIDGTGLFVYPGMIDGGTQLGLTEIGSVPGGEDTQEVGDFNPHNVALTAVNPHSELIPVTRVNGVTTAITSAEGGLISGQAGLIDLMGWTPAEMAVRRQAAMVVSYPSLGGGGFGGGGGGFGGQQRSESERREELDRRTRSLRSYFADAKAYSDMKGRVATAGGVRKANQAMEAMAPIVRGEIPVIFDVTTADQIRGVLALADTFGIKVVLRGAREAWRLADTLAMRKIPVIVGPLTSVPGADDPYDMTYANPGVLARAGVKIAFQTSDAANSRNLPYNAALAVAYGLDADAALRALTINAAEIFGVADRYGSLAPGKVANVMVTTGDPMDVRSVVRHLFIRGQPVPLDDRHTRLYEQFRARPRAQ